MNAAETSTLSTRSEKLASKSALFSPTVTVPSMFVNQAYGVSSTRHPSSSGPVAPAAPTDSTTPAMTASIQIFHFQFIATLPFSS